MKDKEKIKEEIEKQIDYAEEDTRYTESYREGLIAAYQTIKALIDSLPEEPASEDLEEEIDRFEDWLNNFNQSDYPTSYTVRDIARHFAEWQKEKDKQLVGATQKNKSSAWI